MLDDEGLFFLQYAGLRKSWQYEDLIWGLFMNKYIFPGADASTPLGFVTDKLEGAGFEIVSVDNIGVHYSATIYCWYRNWMGNREKVIAAYGDRWFRIWEYFLASSVITSRQGGATCFQILLRKNLNIVHSIEHVPIQFGLQVPKLPNHWLSEDFAKVVPGEKEDLIIVLRPLIKQSLVPYTYTTTTHTTTHTNIHVYQKKKKKDHMRNDDI